MASRRTVMAKDRKRSSPARKRTHRAVLERQARQAALIQKLWAQAKAGAAAD